jgi:lipoprotein-anchoring transpeptidase ErfK/SrfK
VDALQTTARIAVVVAMLAGCAPAALPQSAPGSTRASQRLTAPRIPTGVFVAESRQPVIAIYRAPGASVPMMALPNPWSLNGTSSQPIPQAFLVLQRRPDGWVKVLLPQRPNGASGWVEPAAVKLLIDPYWLVVGLRRHTITVYRAGSPQYSGPVATGAPATPTPAGLFYIRVLLHTTDPESAYGPYAYGLSAHSEALTTFDCGDAEIGVHGNNDASALGHSVTHGCVRMDNTEISRLAQILPLGTPVEVSE